jgi:ABC-type microcin C transport system permease subunit YejB
MPGRRRRDGRQPCPNRRRQYQRGHYRGGRGLDPEVIAEITHRYGFDKPLHERYLKMLAIICALILATACFAAPQCCS